jgi:acetolactate synthase-1/2/3 large subunit
VAAIVESLPSKPDRTEYLAEVAERKADWETELSSRRDTDRFPFTLQRPLAALRRVMDRDGIVIVGSGNTQGAVKQTFPVFEPRTHLTTGGFSSMGWPVPAALGAKLAAPERQVASITGDGDFLMTVQEIGVAVQHDIPAVFIVQDNSGYISIRGGQRIATDRIIGTEFNRPDGTPYSPSFKDLGKSFGLESFRVESAADLEPTFKRAFDAQAPVLVELPTDRDLASPFVSGWLDFPPLPHITDERANEYRDLRAREQHQ